MNDKQENEGEPIMVPMPDGSKVNINTKEGANAFLEGTPNFLHFSSNLKEVRKLIRRRKRLNKRQCNQLSRLYESINCIAKNADPDVFATKVPQSEIQDWLNYIIAEIKTFTKNEKWFSSGILNVNDSTTLRLCIDMFRHGNPVSMAFEGDFFHVYASFLKARKGTRKDPILSLTECRFGLILVRTMATSSVHGWSVEKILNKFEASGLLEQIIRSSVLFKPANDNYSWDEIGLIIVLTELQSCPGILARKFQIGEPCGDILYSVFDDVQDGSISMKPVIFERLWIIAFLSEAMDSTDFEAKLVSGTCSFCCEKTDAKLRCCDRCGFVFYCSKECQEADWKMHKCNCHKLNTAALDRLFSLRMNIVTFLNLNFQSICEEMSETGLEATDLAVEISFMPDENGVIHALQDPPSFKVVPIGDYVSGEFPEWFADSRNKPHRKWFKDMAEMVEKVCKPLFGTLVVYHADRTHIDVGILEQFHEAEGNTLEDIRLQLGTKYWCSQPASFCQKYPRLVESLP